MKVPIPVLFCLFLTLPISDVPTDAPDAITVSPSLEYYCPPCGCCSDDKMLEAPGECSACPMKLIKTREGLAGHTAVIIADFFRDSAVSNAYFDRIMYPGFFFGLLMSVLLLMKSRRNPSIAYLGTFTLVLSLYPFQNRLCEMSDLLLGGADVLFFPLSFILLAGPFLFFYARSLTGGSPGLTTKDLLHFIPGLIGLACYTFIYLKTSVEKHHLLLSPGIIAFSHYEQASAVSLTVVYLLFSVRRVKLFKLKENGFAAKRKSLVWLQKFLVAIAVLLGVWSAVLLLDLLLYDFGLSIMTYYPLWLGLALFLFWVGYQCLFHNKEIFNGNGGAINTVSYGRNLSADSIKGHVAALTELMETEKPHLDSTLNLNKLADQVSMHPKDLTIVLNQGLETNFYDFLNEYRIEEAKDKLVDPQNEHLTILAIAYDSGFNSKSSFNALFKKYVKMTPKEFIKKFEDQPPSSRA